MLYIHLDVIIIKSSTVCFSGHRKIPPEEQSPLIQRLENEVYRLIQEGYTFFAAGGALGFDTLAAQVVLKYRRLFPGIKLILVLPCRSQSKYWTNEDREVYNEIIRQADNVQYASGEYDRGCMFKRNRQLIDMSSVCVCYLREATGGTAYTVKYAKASGISVINVANSQ